MPYKYATVSFNMSTVLYPIRESLHGVKRILDDTLNNDGLLYSW